MKVKILEKAKTICSNQSGVHNYFGWPTIARLGDGSLMTVSSGFRIAHICPFGKVVGIRSYDEGKSWTRPEVIIDTPLDDRDAGIMPFGKDGIMVTSFTNAPAFQRRNAGMNLTYVNSYLDVVEKNDNWKKYLGSTLSISRDNGKSFTDPVLVPISSPHGPCVLSDGSILYVGRLFDDAGKESHIECHTVSEDGKITFRSSIADVSPDLLSCEPHAIQLSNGRIVVHIRVQDNKGKIFTTYQSISDDMGYTFTEPVQILSDKGGAPAHIIEHSSGAVVSVYGYREKPYGIRAMISKDNCESFETDLIITDEEPTGDLGYPASAELADGSILTIYYTRESATSASVIKQIIWKIEE